MSRPRDLDGFSQPNPTIHWIDLDVHPPVGAVAMSWLTFALGYVRLNEKLGKDVWRLPMGKAVQKDRSTYGFSHLCKRLQEGTCSSHFIVFCSVLAKDRWPQLTTQRLQCNMFRLVFGLSTTAICFGKAI